MAMATTKDDIKNGGGSCTYVATDFWECTDRDGKVWWCDSTSCQPKPRMVGQLGTIHIDTHLLVIHDPDSGKVTIVAPIVTDLTEKRIEP